MNPLFKEPLFMRRPWGFMIRIIHTDSFWLKIIRVRPGHRTSDQLHYRRTEYHIPLTKPWSVRRFLPRERHRMEGGLYLEFAHGIPREDDIQRFADDYGRE